MIPRSCPKSSAAKNFKRAKGRAFKPIPKEHEYAVTLYGLPTYVHFFNPKSKIQNPKIISSDFPLDTNLRRAYSLQFELSLG